MMANSDSSVRKNTTEWNKAREAAKQRDGGQCVLCSSKEDIEVHHIDYVPDNHALWNLITLCKTCHVPITKPKSDDDIALLLEYIKILQTSHFHPDATLEIVLRHLGGYNIGRTIEDDHELEEILEESWGYYGFQQPEEDAPLKPIDGFGEPKYTLARMIEDGLCPVPFTELKIGADFMKITCKHECGTPTCDCVGFNNDECPYYSCKKTWCKDAIVDSREVRTIGDAESLPFIILRAMCDPRTPSGYNEQSTLLEYEKTC